MKVDRQDDRRKEIERAAYELLSEKGYKATSMLQIAKRAKASNETLYRWYGNKQTLFQALVEANAADARALLEKAIADEDDALETLARVGPVLLAIVTGERAVALNRAAAVDVSETNTLGRTIADAGKGSVMPLIGAVIEQGRNAQVLVSPSAAEAAALFLDVLIGDAQIRRVIDVAQAITGKEAERRTARALQVLQAVYGPASKAKRGESTIPATALRATKRAR